MTTPVFPVLPGQGFPKRSPEWLTRVQESVSGKQTRKALWSYPRWTWEISFEMLRGAAGTPEFQQLLNLYNGCRGSFGTFLYTDPDDCAVTGQALGIGDGATTRFQLVRAFGGLGGFVEPVWAPASVAAVSLDGVVQPASSYGVSAWGATSPGVVTFAAAPAGGEAVSADFSFYFPCRFTDDKIEFEKILSGIYALGKLTFQSVK